MQIGLSIWRNLRSKPAHALIRHTRPTKIIVVLLSDRAGSFGYLIIERIMETKRQFINLIFFLWSFIWACITEEELADAAWFVEFTNGLFRKAALCRPPW
jgi:hypothetical protein